MNLEAEKATFEKQGFIGPFTKIQVETYAVGEATKGMLEPTDRSEGIPMRDESVKKRSRKPLQNKQVAV